MNLEAITKPYVDFQYYKETYKGSTITSQEAFDECYREAEAFLDMQTFHRIPKITEADEVLLTLIKYAVCSMADVYANHKTALKTATSGVTSENRDGYSLSYGSAADRKSAYQLEMKECGYKYLLDTGLLYRGGGPYAYKR